MARWFPIKSDYNSNSFSQNGVRENRYEHFGILEISGLLKLKVDLHRFLEMRPEIRIHVNNFR